MINFKPPEQILKLYLLKRVLMHYKRVFVF